MDETEHNPETYIDLRLDGSEPAETCIELHNCIDLQTGDGPVVPVCSIHGERSFDPGCEECQDVRGEFRRVALMLRKAAGPESPDPNEANPSVHHKPAAEATRQFWREQLEKVRQRHAGEVKRV